MLKRAARGRLFMTLHGSLSLHGLFAGQRRILARLGVAEAKRFARDTAGVAAIEFAFVIPIFIILFFGAVEYSKYTMESRRAEMAVDFAAEYLSRDGDGMLEVAERHIVEDIWMIMNPTSYLATELRGGQWANGYSRALASVRFEKTSGCSKDCAYVPKVVWSFLFQDVIEKPVSVQCELTVVANTASLDGTNIREGVTGRAPVIIADFTYPYKPLLEGWLLPATELHVNAVKRTRNGVALDHVSDSFVKRCDV